MTLGVGDLAECRAQLRLYRLARLLVAFGVRVQINVGGRRNIAVAEPLRDRHDIHVVEQRGRHRVAVGMVVAEQASFSPAVAEVP